jgi:hypothetical protein
MTQLHSKLVNNKDISYTPRDALIQSRRIIEEIYIRGYKHPDLDSEIKSGLRRYDLIANDFWGHYGRRKDGDMTVGDIALPWVEVPKIEVLKR